MADFVAVLKKTIGALEEATPEARERVYSKARATIAGKLAALNPPPPAAVVERQKKSLEDAIATVEAEYRSAEAAEIDPVEELETAIASLSIVQPTHVAHHSSTRPDYEADRHPAEPAVAEPASQPETYEETAEPIYAAEPVYEEPPAPQPDAWSPDDEMDDHHEELAPVARREKKRRGMGAALAGVGLLVLLGGAGYAAWLNQDQIAGLFATGPEVVATAPAETAEAPEEAETQPEPELTPLVETAPEEEPETEVAAVSPQQEPDPVQPDAAAPEGPVEKFTERLRSDGTEVDEGPAGGKPEIGEGTSVAAVSAAAEPQTPSPLETTQPLAETAAPAEVTPAAAEPAVAVGQKAIFYEERTNVEQGSAEDGGVVWSLVQESPGGDLPPEPAIRAEATIPGKDMQLRMTIRRNGDPTLPASHIVEMIFLTPDNFEGGGIDNVLRVAFKDTEQAAGNPLLGIPAKIADGFFLVALSDGAAETQANTALLRRQSWIDIPIVYRSGRRALMTLEKGIPGDKVFDEALKAWQAASSG
jgi:hypothetical protein